MKTNTKLYFSVLLCTLFLFTGCKDYVGGNDDDKNRPEIALTYPELVSMLQHYDQTRRKTLNDAFDREHARVHYLDIKKLKEYIRYIEKESKRKNIPMEGINFISAAYPDNYKVEKNRNYQTIVMMPATTINGEEGVSFDPLKSERGVPRPLKDILADFNGYTWIYDKTTVSKPKSKSAAKSTQRNGDDEFSSAGNRMRPSPPN